MSTVRNADHTPDRSAMADLIDVVLSVTREVRFRGYEQNASVKLTPSDCNVLRFIDHHPGATSGEVAHETGLRTSNLSAALRTLEEKGMIERRPDPADRRVTRLYSTALAAENLETIRAEWADQVTRALGPNPGDLTAVVALLSRLERGLITDRQSALPSSAPRPPTTSPPTASSPSTRSRPASSSSTSSPSARSSSTHPAAGSGLGGGR